MRPTTVLAALVLVATPAFAAPAAGPGAPGGRADDGDRRERREQMLRRMHTMLVLEVGETLGLDTAGTIKLSGRLEKFNEQRIRIRLENFDALREVKQIAKGAPGDATALVKRVAANRVKLAQLDQQEIDEIIAGQPPEKIAQVGVLLAKLPKRLEQIGRGMAGERGRGGGRHARD